MKYCLCDLVSTPYKNLIAISSAYVRVSWFTSLHFLSCEGPDLVNFNASLNISSTSLFAGGGVVILLINVGVKLMEGEGFVMLPAFAIVGAIDSVMFDEVVEGKSVIFPTDGDAVTLGDRVGTREV